MKLLLITITASLAIAGGTARAQETKAHQHEHAQPPAVAEQKADDNAGHKDMCACCQEDGGMAAMQEKMKDMMGKMKDMSKDAAKENK